jgi:Flp pilus assembly protein TadG
MRSLRQRRGKRSKSRGAVAVEFALSLFLLIPLLLGMLDYGYYFWVALHATEAAGAAARAAAQNMGTNCASTTAAAVATAVVNHEMAKTNLTSSSWSTLQNGNNCASFNPSWRVQVRVEFAPPASFMLPFMPTSGCAAGNTRFISKAVTMTF